MIDRWKIVRRNYVYVQTQICCWKNESILDERSFLVGGFNPTAKI